MNLINQSYIVNNFRGSHNKLKCCSPYFDFNFLKTATFYRRLQIFYKISFIKMRLQTLQAAGW